MAIGDFNGDGTPDVATANYYGDDVAVQPGDGAGGLRGPPSYPGGIGHQSATSGDFDGDGDVDLAVSNIFGSSVSLLLGDGAGAFAGPASFSAGQFTKAVASGDFDEDGNLDLAVARSNYLSILLGDGAGGFSNLPALVVSGPWDSIATGDFDGDGHLDVVLGEDPSAPHSFGQGIIFLLGDGHGAFSTSATMQLSGAAAFATGDFDADGALDVAVAGDRVAAGQLGSVQLACATSVKDHGLRFAWKKVMIRV